MYDNYYDIKQFSRPHYDDHPQMSISDRAAQFSPFAALTGYDAAVDETARYTEIREELTEDEVNRLNDDLCNDEEGMFPKRSVLTGEWYIRSVSFEDDILSIETALLGTDLGYPDDYLGLELIFIYDDESKEFAFDGINSSAL